MKPFVKTAPAKIVLATMSRYREVIESPFCFDLYTAAGPAALADANAIESLVHQAFSVYV